MHIYTDCLINREVAIRSKENPDKWRKQNRRGMCGFVLFMCISEYRVCVLAIQRREMLDKGEEMKKKCIYI